MLLTSLVNAQNAVLSQNYTFAKDNYSLYDLSIAIQKQEDISISFDAKQLNSKTKIHLPKRTLNLKELSVLLNEKYKIQSKFIGRHIVWKKDNLALTTSSNSSSSTNKKQNKRQIAKRTRKQQESKQKPVEIVVNKEPASIPTNNLNNIASFQDTFSVDFNTLKTLDWKISDINLTNENIDGFERLDNPKIVKFNNEYFKNFGLSVDLSVDDQVFLTPGIALYWNGLSVTGSYAIKTDYSHFRFGVAYSKNISPTIGLSFWANYGSLPINNFSRNYQYDSIIGTPPDSFSTIVINKNVAYSIDANLFKAGLNINCKLTNKFDFFAGLTFNRLQSNIYYEGLKQAPANFMPAQINLTASDFRLLPNTLVISDNFKMNQSQNVRTWLGLQAGIRFFIFKPFKIVE